jgi:phosphomethylpyrimidine synthase
MTQILEARKGNITPEMQAVARSEGVSVEHVLEGVAQGTIVITRNARHTSITPLGVGKGLRTKINANIGTSKDRMSIDDEIAKLKAAVAAGADAVMDLSTGGPIVGIRREILKHSTVSIGTVPIYQAAVETVERVSRS